MTYDLDRLGWLQFQQLCARLLELEGGPAPWAWSGEADRFRGVITKAGLGPPLLEREAQPPVLVQCAWVRPGGERRAAALMARRGGRLSDEGHPRWRSSVLLCNVEPTGAGTLAAGPGAIGRRIDAHPRLRLEMPSLLGLRDLSPLIDPEAAACSSLDVRGARELAAVFVPTRAHHRALGVLAEHRFAVLTGPPEMGKSAIARMIALGLMTDGWEAHECTDPDAVFRALSSERRQVFVADDAFGSTEYRPDAAERWARAMERLLRALDDRHWLIWTSRPAPLHAALRRLHHERGAERFPAPARVLVDAGDLDPIEKTLILFRHGKAAGLPDVVRSELRLFGPAVVGDRHFTPERIRRLVARLAGGDRGVVAAAQQELSTPTEAMASSFGALEPQHRDLLVALLDTPPGVSVPERELVAALRRHHDGSLTHPPAELVDRLTDHFLKVLA